MGSGCKNITAAGNGKAAATRALCGAAPSTAFTSASSLGNFPAKVAAARGHEEAITVDCVAAKATAKSATNFHAKGVGRAITEVKEKNEVAAPSSLLAKITPSRGQGSGLGYGSCVTALKRGGGEPNLGAARRGEVFGGPSPCEALISGALGRTATLNFI